MKKLCTATLTSNEKNEKSKKDFDISEFSEFSPRMVNDLYQNLDVRTKSNDLLLSGLSSKSKKNEFSVATRADSPLHSGLNTPSFSTLCSPSHTRACTPSSHSNSNFHSTSTNNLNNLGDKDEKTNSLPSSTSTSSLLLSSENIKNSNLNVNLFSVSPAVQSSTLFTPISSINENQNQETYLDDTENNINNNFTQKIDNKHKNNNENDNNNNGNNYYNINDKKIDENDRINNFIPIGTKFFSEKLDLSTNYNFPNDEINEKNYLISEKIKNHEISRNENGENRVINLPAISPPRSHPNSPLLNVRTLHEMRKKGSEMFENNLLQGLNVVIYLFSKEGETQRKHAKIFGEKDSSVVSVEFKSTSRTNSKSGTFLRIMNLYFSTF